MSYALLLLCITTLSKSVSIGDQCYLLCNETNRSKVIDPETLCSNKTATSFLKKRDSLFQLFIRILEPGHWSQILSSPLMLEPSSQCWNPVLDLSNIDPWSQSEVIFVTDICGWICYSRCFVAKFLPQFTRFHVEKNWAQKYICGEKWQILGLSTIWRL